MANGLYANRVEANWEAITKKPVLALLLFVLATAFPAQSSLVAGPAEDVQAAMEVLKSKAATLGVPIIKGEEAVAGKTVPAIDFGDPEINKNSP